MNELKDSAYEKTEADQINDAEMMDKSSDTEESTALVEAVRPGSNHVSEGQNAGSQYENVLRRRIAEDPKRQLLARHRLWMEAQQHEYPMPYVPYRIGVYIRFFNQTPYSDEVYLEKHKQWFSEDIALCPKWTLVDFYVDYGSRAPHMESSKEWCRLLGDCFAGKVNLIVTQKVSNVSEDPEEITFIARALATQKKPIGIYFVSEDIFTLASYYREDMLDKAFLPAGWKALPEDELDGPMINALLMIGEHDNAPTETQKERCVENDQ